MCTVTLSYDQNNALARRKLAALLATGLFSQHVIDSVEPTQEEIQTHRLEVEAFLNHSKKSMSNVIARYLWNITRETLLKWTSCSLTGHISLILPSSSPMTHFRKMKTVCIIYIPISVRGDSVGRWYMLWYMSAKHIPCRKPFLHQCFSPVMVYGYMYSSFPPIPIEYEIIGWKFGSFENNSYLCQRVATRSCISKSKRMPKIFEYFGFIFYFYSNEHEPIHVHVIHGGKESIFDLIMMDGALADISVREKKGVEPLTEKDKRTAEAFIRKYHKNIIEKWVKFFVLKQSVRSTSIKKKL